ncbi:MAG TPA: GNAT family protein [Thermomicrobiales bacterium]|jgi:RimJ/RimL family protein N-acetyltransferase
MIRGELVNLRAVERADAPDLFRWFNDPELMRFWGVADATASSNEIQRRIEGWLEEEGRLGRPACLIVETLEGEAVGLVVLGDYRPNDRSVALSLLIGERTRWGQGLGGDTVRTVVDACFAAWNLHRVWLRTEAFNERAQRLYRRCGFRHEATLRGATYLEGEYHDVLVFALLEPDAVQVAGQVPPARSGNR